MRRREFIALLGAATIPWPDFALAELSVGPIGLAISRSPPRKMPNI